ncbi:MAG: hypothetical protein Q8M93_06755 [Polaromonas sp.]|uniref:hypothetical protein n=1 Tax=Polaromonas sp. TaxID=1869339 RepID=UPI00272F099D|nr:hypothetical protein [Polaromonas sp.]MDP2451081.1 hypothetical protein [Polaromonas sp.]MDP3246649.1 hypothetical protein [Polaromonas sp.]MDP3757145.1 hypothetical protein [Polaromonas sp.]MDP3825017.1 hypothetical protein [Polaromonas sp.]
MIRTHTLGLKEACLTAVSALDELVFELVCASPQSLSPVFLDWVADEATPFVERQVARSFATPQFAASLRIGDQRVAMARWVRLWVGPRIVAGFEELAVCLPEFAGSRPAGQPPVPVAAARSGAGTLGHRFLSLLGLAGAGTAGLQGSPPRYQ